MLSNHSTKGLIVATRASPKKKDTLLLPVDISETDTKFVIKMDLPEVKKEDVKINVEKRVLTIQGERKLEKETEGEEFHTIERSYGVLSRSFSLPKTVDETKVTATFKEGMMILQIPKKPVEKKPAPQPIEVLVE